MLETQKSIDLEEIRKGFEMFDVDQTGKISPSELLEVYDAMNLKNKNPFIYNLISSLSEDHDEVSIDELVSYIDEKLSDNQTSEGANLIFDSLCEPNEDTLTLSTLPHIAKISEDRISEKELRYLIERAQMGGEEINFEDFFQILKENSENDNNNGRDGREKRLKLSSAKEKQPTQQVYRKKASGKPSNDNSKISSKKYNLNESAVKNYEDKINVYDVDDDISERKSKRSKNIPINNSNANESKKIDKDNKIEKEKEEILEIKIENKLKENEKEKEELKENGNIHKSSKKESDDEEEENGMENANQIINQSINKYLEKKI